MTSLLGILCKDGVVIGADSSVTLASGHIPTIEQQFEKIEIIDEQIIVAGTGPVGLGQRFNEIVKLGWANKHLNGTSINISKLLSGEALKDFAQTFVSNMNRGEIGFGALVAFPAEKRPHLCEFGATDFQPELRTSKLWYGSMGSAQQITDTFLGVIRDVFWDDGMPNLHDGIFAATWALDYAVQLNAGGVNGPVKIAVLEKNGDGSKYVARILSDDDLAEHRENIGAAKLALKNYKLAHQPGNEEAIPIVPKL